MNRSKETIFAVLFSATLFVACSEDVAERGNSGMPISFELSTVQEKPIVSRASQSVTTNSVLTDKVGNTLSISVTETEGINLTDKESDISITSFTPSTRGSAITTDNISSIGVTAYDHTGSFGGSTATASGGYGFQNETFSVSSQVATTSKKWPVAGHNLSFFAYAPSGAATVANTSAGFPSFDYTASGEQDLLVATSLDNANTITTDGVQGRVPLTFNHALSAIIFTFSDLGTEAGTVSVTIGGVYNTNTYTYSSTGGSWGNSPSGSGTYTVSSLSAADGERTTLSSGVLFLMPQTIPDAATLSISYTDGAGYTHAFSKQLNQLGIASLVPGHTYVYTIGASAIGAMSVSYPAWTGLALADSPVNAYTTSDFFGLFAVDATGKILISNLKMQAGDGANTTLSNASGTNPFLSDKYTYYLYYPWQSDENFTASGKIGEALARNNTAPGYSSGALPDADTFFSNVISGWTVATTQNTVALVKAQDLQVAKISGTSFAMIHKMGLAKITPTAKAVTQKITWTFTAPQTAHTSYTESKTSGTTGSVTASTSFNTATASRLCNSSGYWTIVKATGESTSTAVSLGTVNTVADNWSQSVSGIGFGKYQNYNVTSSRTFQYFQADFPYNSSKTYYEITLPSCGSYKLEVYGASASTNYGTPGIGGYTYGNYNVTSSGTKLYVCVGGAGTCGSYICSTPSNAGYNGGGYGQAGGGGATHIAQTLVSPGVLSAYSSSTNQANVLVVAGGAGNADLGYGGNGGGGNNNGENGVYNGATYGTGGTQSSGGVGLNNTSPCNGSFGQGGSNNQNTTDGRNDCSAGGGGGWYGGGCSTVVGSGPGGGGSGHINTSKISSPYGGTTGGGTLGAKSVYIGLNLYGFPMLPRRKLVLLCQCGRQWVSLPSFDNLADQWSRVNLDLQFRIGC